MAVSAGAITPAINPPNPRAQFTSKDGTLATGNGSGLSTVNQLRTAINGLTPTISCNCSNVGNVLSLTPLNVSPNVSQYYSFWSFAFVSSVTSTGVVSANVITPTGALATLPVLKSHGAANATTGDIGANFFYIMYYVDTLGPAFVLIGV